ncbi:helix-turn-helix domain-containing protein [Laspinema olomoucense]|uniref:helix-turn-helix domain-containing protein n=1 Tax=Laspinema olomoucense TaxID=3231600 RepID=UPI0021BB1F01|nr:helix-turn-helix domain-containing protein [Laspinema sp. D3c]MCT7997334.1 helix-turn-helix domain-containing protein [Laspinema sp. D3c]
MPTPKAKVCTVSDRQHQLLEQISRKATNPHRLVERAKLVLLAADGINNTEISNRLEMNRNQVRMWRARWADASATLAEAETSATSDKKLIQLIVDILREFHKIKSAKLTEHYRGCLQTIYPSCTDFLALCL